MEAFLEYVLTRLVRHPDEVRITAVDKNGVTSYEVRLNPEDIGRVIGREGMTINAIRSLVLAGSAKQGLRCTVDVIGENPHR